MYAGPIGAAFTARMQEYCESNALEFDRGDFKNFRPPSNDTWIRGRLRPNPTIPGPTNSGPLHGTLRGVYVAECFNPINDSPDAAFTLADAVARHFYPATNIPQTLTTSSSEIVLRIERFPDVLGTDAIEGQWQKATALIHYLVYA